MTKQSEIEAPRIYPTMRCRDTEALIGWLKDVVGFTERVVYRNGGHGAACRTSLRALASDAGPMP